MPDFPLADYRTEFQNTLYRAFVTNGLSRINLDGWDGPYLRACTQWALSQGWLNEDWHEEEQYSCHIFTLTTKGKEHFGLIKQETKKLNLTGESNA